MSITGSGSRQSRTRTVMPIADPQGGVVHRRQLRRIGVDRFAVQAEVSAGRWHIAGRHTVIVEGTRLSEVGRWWWAVWESGSGAVLDGVSALLAHGMTGFTQSVLHVSVPTRSHIHPLESVRLHQHRTLGPLAPSGVPRIVPAMAAIRAAQWAVSDRQAALLLCLPVQQRLVTGGQLLQQWSAVPRSRRRSLIGQVVHDIADGAQSLGELDFGRLCRRHGLPVPRRQSLRRLPNGNAYLDVEFDGGLVVEIDGRQHLSGLNPVDDALRANEVTLEASRVLRLPLLGLRVRPEAFMAQIARALGVNVLQEVSPGSRSA